MLSENFEDAKALFSSRSRRSTTRTVMLAATGSSLPRTPTRYASRSIRCRRRICPACGDGTCEDLFYYVERLIAKACSEGAAGRLHTARSRNDIDMTMYRMCGAAHHRLARLSTCAAPLPIRRSAARPLRGARTPSALSRPRLPCLLAVVEQQARRPAVGGRMTGQTRIRSAPAPSPAPGFRSIGSSPPSCSGLRRRLAIPTAASPPSTTCSRPRLRQRYCSWGSNGSSRICCCGTAEFGYLRLGDSFVQASSIVPQSATRSRSSTRARSPTRRSARPRRLSSACTSVRGHRRHRRRSAAARARDVPGLDPMREADRRGADDG